jgi:hypothetical protein
LAVTVAVHHVSRDIILSAQIPQPHGPVAEEQDIPPENYEVVDDEETGVIKQLRSRKRRRHTIDGEEHECQQPEINNKGEDGKVVSCLAIYLALRLGIGFDTYVVGHIASGRQQIYLTLKPNLKPPMATAMR